MSVKNILDGTIKIEGGGGSEMPDNPEVSSLHANSGITVGMGEGNGLTEITSSAVITPQVEVSDQITTKNLTVTGGITIGGVQVLTQTDAIFSGL